MDVVTPPVPLRLTSRYTTATLANGAVMNILGDPRRLCILFGVSTTTVAPTLGAGDTVTGGFGMTMALTGYTEFVWQRHGDLVKGFFKVTSLLNGTSVSCFELLNIG